MELFIIGTLLILALTAGGAAVWLLTQRVALRSRVAELEREVEQRYAAAERAEAEHGEITRKLESLGEELSTARGELGRLETQRAEELKRHEEKLRAYEEAREQMLHHFKSLSADILKSNSEEFLKKAKELTEAQRTKTIEDFDQRRKSIDEMVKPVRESLKLYEERLSKIEESRREAHTKLYEQVNFLKEMGERLKLETNNLVKALRAPQVRGRWGELQLKRVVELAGMVAHCDFVEQESIATENGAQRPDMIINLPNNRRIIVDAKCPIMAYLDAIEAPNDDERASCLARFAKHVKEKVHGLSGKTYWSQFDESPEFVVMFLPGDIFLGEAVRHDPALLEYALEKRVIPATPTTLIALLKAVAYGWQQEKLAENAAKIFESARTLHDRLTVLSAHASKLGGHLDKAVKSYNDFVGSLESRVMPQARRIEELEGGSHKTLTESKPVDHQVRPIRDQELLPSPSSNGA
ncbi:MAG: DNA recombination protein RmuC [Phycisphaerales bacterium]